MKTLKTLMLAVEVPMLAGIITLASGCSKSGDDKNAQAAPVIDVAEAVTDSVTLSKSYPAVLQADNSADVVARVNGYLLSQNYKSGDRVRKGQVLFRIEDTQYRDAVTQAQAALENARSAYAYASKNYEAMQRALRSDAVAQIQVLEAKNALEQSQAQIKNCEAALSSARTMLGYCTITAPFDGAVTASDYSVGAYIGGGAQPVKLAEIYDDKILKAEFFIDDASFQRGLGTKESRAQINYNSVPVTFNEQLPHAYTGRLNYISPDVNTGTGTLKLRLELDNTYRELRDGMYCMVRLPLKKIDKAILVKDASISTSQTDKFLYVVNDSNRVVFTPITVGDMANDSMRIVTSGIQPGQRYVTRALMKVRAGMEVNPRLEK